MKRSIFNLIASIFLLGLGWLVPHSIFNVSIETAPMPDPVLPADYPPASLPASTGVPEALPIPTDLAAPARDPSGELYFTITTAKEYIPPAEPPVDVDESTARLARLPGSCVVGLAECPEPETVTTPFNMKDVFRVGGGGLVWSPDGRYGLLVTHPEDELSTGKTKDELEQLAWQSPADFEISPSTLYLFDAQLNTWQEVYRAERKFFFTPVWSPDGQWVAFQVLNSVWAFHPSQADDGIYLVRPDGSELQQLSAVNASIQGWVGNSLLLQRRQGVYPATNYTFELLFLNGEIKPLFSSDRQAFYALAPAGGALLAGDAPGETNNTPTKSVDVLALDGSVIQPLGTFSNYISGIYPFAWSPDVSLVAFANQRRVYIGTRTAQPALLGSGVGLPADGSVREVYVADDTYVEPSFWKFQFSSDNQYLLMDVYDGTPHFVAIALETGQARPVEIKGLMHTEQVGFFSWRP